MRVESLREGEPVLPENLYFNQNIVLETPLTAQSVFWRDCIQN